jgi:hypothetical protein
MPGPGIHISVMHHVAEVRATDGYTPGRSELVDPTWTGPDPAELGRINEVFTIARTKLLQVRQTAFAAVALAVLRGSAGGRVFSGIGRFRSCPDACF